MNGVERDSVVSVMNDWLSHFRLEVIERVAEVSSLAIVYHDHGGHSGRVGQSIPRCYSSVDSTSTTTGSKYAV